MFMWHEIKCLNLNVIISKYIYQFGLKFLLKLNDTLSTHLIRHLI